MHRTAVNTERLQFLIRVVQRESRYLQQTDARLFTPPLTLEQLHCLEHNDLLAERIDAFVSRFGRLQDTVGDKVLPSVLRYFGETPRTVLDNLDRAERLGWIASSETWMTMRLLRNYMVHEYIENPVLLLDALEQAHQYIPQLLQFATTLIAQITTRLGE